MEWLNEAPHWTEYGETITMHSAPKTDFWRVTYNDIVIDNGHFYYERWSGDFQADVKISGKYTGLYDQAGLMVRVDGTHWMKCGVEFFEGKQHASVVVTRDFSDWSIVPLLPNVESFWVRVLRKGATIEVYYALDGESYQMLRQAYLTPLEAVEVGLLCASPVGDGFFVEFEGFKVQAL
jgi:regulation of enolase protein 1 (concanavalin A-like superfamily)